LEILFKEVTSIVSIASIGSSVLVCCKSLATLNEKPNKNVYSIIMKNMSSTCHDHIARFLSILQLFIFERLILQETTVLLFDYTKLFLYLIDCKTDGCQ